jgi:hypothetical protein
MVNFVFYVWAWHGVFHKQPDIDIEDVIWPRIQFGVRLIVWSPLQEIGSTTALVLIEATFLIEMGTLAATKEHNSEPL